SWLVSRGEPGYPVCLENLADPPAALFGLGDCDLLGDLEPGLTVTIVGSRRSGGYGLGVARELGCVAAGAGLVVVSGMALGCDSAAHQGALDGRGQTIAVLGGGVDVISPPSKAHLHRRIVASGGAVISEYPSGTVPEPHHFPARNRIMAALAKLTVVVEGTYKSGTQITSRRAQDLGRDLGAVPGPVTSPLSELPNELINSGATMVRGAQDLLDAMLGVGVLAAKTIGPELDPRLSAALKAVGAGAASADAVATQAGLDGGATAVALARLELMGYLVADAVGRYARTSLREPG
ncbi:MAG: DNA-protecting protein DprA, partial [Actinomycetota bacterium]|nr:DNA-protecting protein DprA [Actinomycetota bacterium]